jgi:hypothetical protein
VRLPEWRINCRRAWAALLQLGPPPGECRTNLRGRLSSPRRRWDGRPVHCRELESGHCRPGGLRQAGYELSGPGMRFSRLHARWIGARSSPGRRARAALAWASKRGWRRGVRGCRARTDTWPGHCSYCSVWHLERLARKDNEGRVALAALRKESPMTDLIEAAQQGDGPRVEVAPLMMVAEFRGVGQLACCCRRVNARVPVSWSRLSSWPLLIEFYAGAPERCRQGW